MLTPDVLTPDVLTPDVLTPDVLTPDVLTPDGVEQRLVGIESMIGILRVEQMRLLRQADIGQLAGRDGSRSLQEWAACRLDVAPELARDLVCASRTILDDLEDCLADGEVSFDRAVAVSRLVAAGACEGVVEGSFGYDISGVRRVTAAQRRIGPGDEQATFGSRHAAVQMTLDQTSANVWATLTGVDSTIVTQALHESADRLPLLPDGTRDSRAHRHADAFVAIFNHAPRTQPPNQNRPTGEAHMCC